MDEKHTVKPIQPELDELVLPQAINALHTAARQMGNAVEQGGDD